ncbi:MAG: DUF4783 domain-containing protein [Tannerella sp.]|jgi:hypothetical protein|nr:DUF4783 domain-containing protein [Tannerella sp.]
MKKLICTLAFILSVLSTQAADITAIADAFKSGNATLLAACMDTEVDMALPETARKVNGREAVELLTRFFEAGKVSGFTVAHHADKKESGFVVGKLTTGKGDFRVNITYLTREDKVFIQSIRIE